MALGQACAPKVKNSSITLTSSSDKTAQQQGTSKCEADLNAEIPDAKNPAELESGSGSASCLDEQWLADFDPGPFPEDMIDFFKAMPPYESQEFLTLGANHIVRDAINSGWEELKEINNAAGIQSVPGQFFTNDFEFNYSTMLLEHVQTTLHILPAVPEVASPSQSEVPKEGTRTQQEPIEQGQESIQQGQESIQQEQESIEQERESIQQEQESIEQEQESIEQERESIEQEQESIEQEQESSRALPSPPQSNGEQNDARGSHEQLASTQQSQIVALDQSSRPQQQPPQRDEPSCQDSIDLISASTSLPASLPARLPGPLPDLPSYLFPGTNSKGHHVVHQSASDSPSHSRRLGPCSVQWVPPPHQQPIAGQKNLSSWQPKPGPLPHFQHQRYPVQWQSHGRHPTMSPSPAQLGLPPSHPLPSGPRHPYAGQFDPARLPASQGNYEGYQWQSQSNRNHHSSPPATMPRFVHFPSAPPSKPQLHGKQHMYQGNHPSPPIGPPLPRPPQGPLHYSRPNIWRPLPTPPPSAGLLPAPPPAPYTQPFQLPHPVAEDVNHHGHHPRTPPCVAAPGTARPGPLLQGPPPKSWMAPEPRRQDCTTEPHHVYHGPSYPSQQFWQPAPATRLPPQMVAPMQGQYVPQMGGSNVPVMTDHPHRYPLHHHAQPPPPPSYPPPPLPPPPGRS